LTAKRKLQSHQAYSRLYYDTKLKSVVEARYKQHIDETPKGRQKKQIVFAAQVVKELFKAETDEVKAEVEAYCQKLLLSGVITLGNDEDEEPTDNEEAEQERTQRNLKMQS